MKESMLLGLARKLKQKQKALGMTMDALARRSGLSRATLHRLFAGNTMIKWGNVETVAEVLGVNLSLRQSQSASEMIKKQANLQAKKLVGIVQGTMALEAQGLEAAVEKQMVKSTYKKLLQAPLRKLW